MESIVQSTVAYHRFFFQFLSPDFISRFYYCASPRVRTQITVPSQSKDWNSANITNTTGFAQIPFIQWPN